MLSAHDSFGTTPDAHWMQSMRVRIVGHLVSSLISGFGVYEHTHTPWPTSTK